MCTLKLLEEADKEYAEVAQWYETRKEGLGKRFIDTIKIKLDLIREYPERYAKRKGNFREVPLKIFPYNIVYTFYKKEGVIIVNAIFHTSRNPRKKYRKK